MPEYTEYAEPQPGPVLVVAEAAPAVLSARRWASAVRGWIGAGEWSPKAEDQAIAWDIVNLSFPYQHGSDLVSAPSGGDGLAVQLTRLALWAPALRLAMRAACGGAPRQTLAADPGPDPRGITLAHLVAAAYPAARFAGKAQERFESFAAGMPGDRTATQLRDAEHGLAAAHPGLPTAIAEISELFFGLDQVAHTIVDVAEGRL